MDEAKRVIILRLKTILLELYTSYLTAASRACQASLENLHAKYAVTSADIEKTRLEADEKLKLFLEELGYG